MEDGFRMFIQDGKVWPVLDLNSLDDQDIMDRLEQMVERFDGIYVSVNVGKNLPNRMKALYSNGRRAPFACPHAEVRPMLDYLDLAISGSIFDEMVEGYLFSNVIPPLFRIETDQLDDHGNHISMACGCSECTGTMAKLQEAWGPDRLVLSGETDYTDRFDFAQRIWLWSQAFARDRQVLDQVIAERNESYVPIMDALAKYDDNAMLFFPETEYPDLALHVNGLSGRERLSYGISERWLDSFAALVASPLFELDWDEEHIMAWNVEDGQRLLRLKYLEPGRRMLVESKLSPEVMDRVLQG